MRVFCLHLCHPGILQSAVGRFRCNQNVCVMPLSVIWKRTTVAGGDRQNTAGVGASSTPTQTKPHPTPAHGASPPRRSAPCGSRPHVHVPLVMHGEPRVPRRQPSAQRSDCGPSTCFAVSTKTPWFEPCRPVSPEFALPLLPKLPSCLCSALSRPRRIKSKCWWKHQTGGATITFRKLHGVSMHRTNPLKSMWCIMITKIHENHTKTLKKTAPAALNFKTKLKPGAQYQCLYAISPMPPLCPREVNVKINNIFSTKIINNSTKREDG